MNTADLDDPVGADGPITPTDPAGPEDPIDPADPENPADPEDPADPGDPVGPDDPWHRRGHGIALAAIPLAIFALTRAVQVWLVGWLLPADSDSSIRDRLLSWDTGWFVRVAEEGYPNGYTFDDSGHVAANGLAFFPGFPMLVRGVHLLTGGSYETAALVAGSAAGCVATLAVYALGLHLYDFRVGVALATLFSCQPMSVVLSMGYSEGLFVAFVAATLVAARRDAWLTAGVLGLGAALSRPTGAAAALGLAVAAGMRLWSLGASADGSAPRVPRWRPAAAAVLALAGVPGYLLWVGLRAGDLRAWFDIQTAGWGTTFDFGSSATDFVVRTLRTGEDWVALSVAWLLIFAVLLAVAAVVHRVWPPLLVYGLLSLILVVGQAGFYHSKPRLMVPVIVILVPLAVGLGRARVRTAVLALTGYAALGLWYGAYLITVWHFAI